MLLLLAAALVPIATFSIHEEFGVRHPTQIVDFDFNKGIDPGRAYMIGPHGTEVPFQILRDGKIAVEAAVPSHGAAGWKLYTGHAPQRFPNAVRIKETPAYYEIVNGLTGVRIARASHPAFAPIQGILYRDGTWTATGPNSLQAAGRASAMTVRFLENGPLKVKVEVAYAIDRPPLEYGGKLLLPAGPGFYRSTIEVQAGQPSILIEDDTDSDLRYSFDIYHGLEPDQARYRGHHATSVENGREPDGRQYRQWNERPPMDAIRDLQYRTPAPSDYNGDPPNIRRMAVWDPWVYDSGWYWQLYNAKAASQANLLGIFAGPASEAIGAAHNGAGIFTAPGPAAGIAFETHRRSPDARVFPRVRIAWRIFIGTKADLDGPREAQNIARQMNLHGGINLNKVYRYQTTFADPPGGYQPLYMNRAATASVIARVGSDPDYYRRLYDAEPTARPLLDMWRDASGRKLKELAASIADTARDLLDALVNGDGIYDFRFHYWHGGLEMSRQAIWIDSILTGTRASAEDRARVKAAAVLFANVLWDSDFVPMFDGHGLNLGTANMPVQQNQYRDLYAVLLGRDTQGAVSRALYNLRQTVNESGAAMGSTHYIGASMGPLLSTFQQLQTAGIADAFRDQPRLARFAEFYLNLLTPPEPRFGGYRKLVSIGDGSTESSELFGQLATGFAAAGSSLLSARLMAAWQQSGAMHSGFHGSTILKIDESLPVASPHLGDATFPGWYTVLRNGWGTRNETAVWLVDGDFYRDHAHEDNGTVVIYALGAPLSLDWGSMYSPQSPGALMHSLPVPESALHTAWDTTAPPLDQIGFRWRNATQQAFESLPDSAHVRATYQSPDGATTWTRSVYSIHPDEANPIIAIQDEFNGPSVPRILTLNLTAEPESPVRPLDLSPARLPFTGQWLIDWDLYAQTSAPAETVTRTWTHHWHPNREQNEFAKANGRPFEESQSILRIKGAGPFTTILLPHRKSAHPNPSVKTEGSKTIITWANSTAIFDSHCYSFNDGPITMLTSFGTEPCESGGIAVQGGAAEIRIQPDGAAITAHGAAGVRRIALPGALPRFVDYQGGPPMTVIIGKAM